MLKLKPTTWPSRRGRCPRHSDPEHQMLIRTWHQSGLSLVEMAKRLNIPTSTMAMHCRNLNLSKYKHLTVHQLDDVKAMIDQQMTQLEIGKRMGVSASTIRMYLRKHDLHSRGQRASALSDVDFEELWELWDEHAMRQTDIADLYDTSQDRVSRFFREHLGRPLMNRPVRHRHEGPNA